MKFTLQSAASHQITAHGAGFVRVGNTEWREAVWVGAEAGAFAWGIAATADISALSWPAIVATAPELIIIGTGARQVFLRPEALRPLIEKRIGYELMDTAAACRTYNVLLGEGRRVACALLMP